ncbi:hypothetical protein ABT381_05055 [Streptomyces sp. NPDC000151]|uniref:hypothetical protein n=1 Tax=Streptomyces sp. NPDC000151 TaxID=3154244 RepID=UPI00332625B8
MAPVVAIDLMEHPDDHGDAPSRARLLEWFARDVAHIAGAPDPLAGYDLEQVDNPDEALVERLRAGELLDGDTDQETIDGLLSRFVTNARALADHKPGSYGSPVVLIRASEGASEAVTSAWATHFTEHVAVHTFEGDHYSLLRPDQLDALITTVRDAWATSDHRTAVPSLGSHSSERNSS